MDTIDSKFVELARLGEFYCTARDYQTGLRFYEAAIHCGTNDTAFFAAICSQAGAAAFHANENEKALLYLKQDLKVCRLLGDRVAEAKCCGNLTHILKALRRFDDAATFGEHQLALLRSLRDRVGESRALFTLAGVYHAKAKHIAARSASLTQSTTAAATLPSDVTGMRVDANTLVRDVLMVPNSSASWCSTSLVDSSAKSNPAGITVPDATDSPTVRPVSYPIVESCESGGDRRFQSTAVRDALQRAAGLYEEAYALSEALEDRALQGRACGNLANAAYMLGDFATALRMHRTRYQLATAYGDVAAQRRALSNAGNAALLLGDAPSAIEAYRGALELVRSSASSLGLRRGPADAVGSFASSSCANMSTTFNPQGSFSASLLGGAAFNASHVAPQSDEDRTTLEAQTCFLLATAYLVDQQLIQALAYFEEHFRIARRLSDRVGQLHSCQQLANVHALLGNRQTATRFARRHLRLTTSLGDEEGTQNAREMLQKLADGAEPGVIGITPAKKAFLDVNSNFKSTSRQPVQTVTTPTGIRKPYPSATTSTRERQRMFGQASYGGTGELDVSLSFDELDGDTSDSDCSLSQTSDSAADDAPDTHVQVDSELEYDAISRDVNADPTDNSAHSESVQAGVARLNHSTTVPKEARNNLSSVSRGEHEATFGVGGSDPNILDLPVADEFNNSRLAKTLTARTPPGALQMLAASATYQRTLDSFASAGTPRRTALTSRLNTSVCEADRLNKSLKGEIERLSNSLCHETEKLNVSFKRESERLNASLKQEIERFSNSLIGEAGELGTSSSQPQPLNASKILNQSRSSKNGSLVRTPDRAAHGSSPAPGSSARRPSMEQMHVINISPGRANSRPATTSQPSASGSGERKSRTATPSRMRVVFSNQRTEQILSPHSPTFSQAINLQNATASAATSSLSSYTSVPDRGSQPGVPPTRYDTFRERLDALNENVDRQSLASAELRGSRVSVATLAESVSGSSIRSNASSSKHRWSSLFKKPKPVMGLAAFGKPGKRGSSKKHQSETESRGVSVRTNSMTEADALQRTGETLIAAEPVLFDQYSLASSEQFSSCSSIAKLEQDVGVIASDRFPAGGTRKCVGETGDMFDLIDRCASLRFNDQRSDVRLLRSQIYSEQAFAKPNKTQIRHSVLNTRQLVLPMPSSAVANNGADGSKGGLSATLARSNANAGDVHAKETLVDSSKHQDASHKRLAGDSNERDTSNEFFEMIDRLQSSRLDDQRSNPPKPVPHHGPVMDEGNQSRSPPPLRKTSSFLKFALRSPKRRRAQPLALAPVDINQPLVGGRTKPAAQDDQSSATFSDFDRESLNSVKFAQPLTHDADLNILQSKRDSQMENSAPRDGNTLPKEDFLSLLSRVSSSRIDTQRAAMALPGFSAVESSEVDSDVQSAHKSKHKKSKHKGDRSSFKSKKKNAIS